MSAVAEGTVAMELARGYGRFSAFNSIHTGLVMAAIATLVPSRSAEVVLGWAGVEHPGERHRCPYLVLVGLELVHGDVLGWILVDGPVLGDARTAVLGPLGNGVGGLGSG
jgi:hypothetical protein